MRLKRLQLSDQHDLGQIQALLWYAYVLSWVSSDMHCQYLLTKYQLSWETTVVWLGRSVQCPPATNLAFCIRSAFTSNIMWQGIQVLPIGTDSSVSRNLMLMHCSSFLLLKYGASSPCQFLCQVQMLPCYSWAFAYVSFLRNAFSLLWYSGVYWRLSPSPTTRRLVHLVLLGILQIL